MLEGLEISVVKLSESVSSTNETRWDSEYYLKDYIQNEKIIKRKNCYVFSDLCNFVKKGIFDLSPENYIDNGVPFIRTSEIKEMTGNFSTTVFLDELVHKENLKTELLPNDLVFTKIGAYIGDVAMLPAIYEKYNFSQNVAGASLKDKSLGAYLVSFFASKYGKKQIIRSSMLSGQGKLELSEIRNYKIPIPSDSIRNRLSKSFSDSQFKLEESKSLYSQAEDLLLGKLGLKDWQPKNTLHTTKKFSDFAQSGRLDAEYYQPKYDDLFERLQKVDCKTIKEIQIINYRGFQPEYVENGKIDVINSKHILEDGLDYENFEKTDEVSFNNAVRAQVKYGDILTYTTGANIGRTQVYLSEKKAMASNHVNMLRVKDVNPIYLALVLNSKIGRMQTEKSSTGSAQVELYPDDLASFIIPILPEQIQTKIASLIQQSFECKAQSKQLLEDAKRMVEEEIEKN